MKGGKKTLFTVVVLAAAVFTVTFGLYVYAELADSNKATVINVTGFVDAKLKETGKVVTLAEGMKLGVGDEITTDSESSVEMKLKDGSVVKIGPDSVVVIKEMGQVEVTKVSKSRFELVKGKIRAVVNPFLAKDSKFTVETENATIGVRGTDFGAIFDQDFGNTSVISIESCVSVLAKNFPGLDAIDVCTNEELLVSGSSAPGAAKAVDKEKLKEFLEEMGLVGEEGKGKTGEIEPPEITSAYLNNRINLEDLDDTLTLTKDDLSFDGKLTVTGTAEDAEYTVSKVEVSTDGGMTWGEATGRGSWKFEFKPEVGFEYELMMRATNEKGVVSDPDDFGSFAVKYTDVGYETIAKNFIENFFRYLKSSNSTGIGELISDLYDGKVGEYFTKDELLDDSFEEFFSQGRDLSVSYSINQVSFDGKSIIVSTSWTASSGGGSESGTTKWWLSQADNYTLVHTEGKWFVPTLYYYAGTPELTVTKISTGVGVCPDGVLIMMVAPKIPIDEEMVHVDIDVYCGIPHVVTLTRSFYEQETGKKGGFGGKFYVYDATSCFVPPPVIPYEPFLYDSVYSSTLKVSYDDYGYDFMVIIELLSGT